MHRSLRTGIIGVCALVLLVASFTAQAAGRSGESDGYTITETGLISNDRVEAEQREASPESLEDRSELIPEESPEEIASRIELADRMSRPTGDSAEGSRQSWLSPTADDIEDCQSSNAARDFAGLVLHHLTWCSVRDVTAFVRDCNASGQCINEGTARFLITTFGYAGVNWREVEFVPVLSDFQLEGNVDRILQTQLTLGMSCTAYEAAICDAGSTNGRTDSIASWQSAPQSYFYFSSPKTGATGVDLVSWYDFTSRAVVGPDTLEYTGNGFRCDSADYLLPNDQDGGCVFDLVVEIFNRLSTTDPDVDQSAVHIYTAQNEPELTLPAVNGKSIPGSPQSGEPLSRLVHDTALYNRNVAIKTEFCYALFGDYAQGGLYDCDEYPFASTYQGAGAGDQRFSLRVVAASDNRTAGARLGAWYTSQRILDSDPFYVVV